MKPTYPIQGISSEIAALCEGMPPEVVSMLLDQPQVTTVRRWCLRNRATETTLQSRFVRAGLPSPRDYLVGMRLYLTAYLIRNGMTVPEASDAMHYSSTSAFHRHVRQVRGITVREWVARGLDRERECWRGLALQRAA